VYQEGGEEEPTLSVKLFYRCRTKAHRARRLHVGTMEVPLARLAAGKTHDLWLPIVPTCDYQLLWNWQKLGNDASNDARDARVSAKSKDRSRTRLGSVHMTVRPDPHSPPIAIISD
jgi:transketolase C-terminal domain/subunit